jgi:hypothetical protein
LQLAASRRSGGASLVYLCYAARGVFLVYLCSAARRGRPLCLPFLKATTGAMRPRRGRPGPSRSCGRAWASLVYLCYAARRGRPLCLPFFNATTGAIRMGRHRGLPLQPEGGHAAHMVHSCPQRPLGPPSASPASAAERKKNVRPCLKNKTSVRRIWTQYEGPLT